MRKRTVYMNPMQQQLHYTAARDVRLVAPRRSGKSVSMADRIMRVVSTLPRGSGGWGGSSIKQLYTRTVPGTLAAINLFFGYEEGKQYGWGRPPSWVQPSIIKPKTYENNIWFANGFRTTVLSAAVVGSANGLTLDALFLDECKFIRESTVREEFEPCLSGNTHPLGDERFSDANPYYRSTYYVSDAALHNRGNWLEKEEEKLDIKLEEGEFAGKTYRELQEELDHIAERTIFFNELLRDAQRDGHRVIVVKPDERQLVRALAEKVMNHEGEFRILPNYGKRINKATVDMLVNYKLIDADMAELLFNHQFLITEEEHFELMMLKQSAKFQDRLRRMRCNSFYFYRPSGLVAIDLLGQSYYDKMKRDLPPLVFQVSILNMKPKRVNDGFYCNLDIENIHGYIPESCPALEKSFTKKFASHIQAGMEYREEYETPDFELLEGVKDCTLDGDLVPRQPLHVSFDYNNLINWIITGQMYRRDHAESLNVLSSMFVKDGGMIQDLVRKWAKYYEPHRKTCRTVYYYYDHTAKFRLHGINMLDIKDTVIQELQRYGWEVVAVDCGRTMEPEQRYKEINEALAGITYPQIRFNKENNEALILAMENTGVRNGYGGFKKDKSGEKLSVASETATPAELRTDGTDAFDTLFVGVKHFRYSLSGVLTPTGHG